LVCNLFPPTLGIVDLLGLYIYQPMQRIYKLMGMMTELIVILNCTTSAWPCGSQSSGSTNGDGQCCNLEQPHGDVVQSLTASSAAAPIIGYTAAPGQPVAALSSRLCIRSTS
jgi:hypothetical protein